MFSVRLQALGILLAAMPLAAQTNAATSEAAKKILASRCWACHSQNTMGGLRLDSSEAIRKGGKSGTVLTPGKPAESRLWQAIARTNPAVKPMPPGPPLNPAELETLQQWIAQGASWPASSSAGNQHWAFQSLAASVPGASIDSLLAKAQGSHKLKPNPQADRRTLIRRAFFDLTGLPPTPDEFEAALTDAQPGWLGRLVDQLLASPHYGEKWGRHWLDVARYGEDDFSGTEVIPYPNAWRYRDWIVAAFNRDMPYDRFLMAQLAGDLLNDPSLVPATGILGLGPWYFGITQPPQARADERHDRIDLVTRGMLGVTLACARCHDHKYDPFTMQDYYALGGVFASTGYKEYPLVPEAEALAWDARKKELDTAEKALNEFLDQQSQELQDAHLPQIAKYMVGVPDLNPKLAEKWQRYLSRPEENHPFLKPWFAEGKTQETAARFQALLEDIVREKKEIDAEAKLALEKAKRNAPKVTRTTVLPGGYRSDEDFNPGAEVAIRSLERNRFVAWNRIFGEAGAPFRFPRDMVPEYLPAKMKTEYEQIKARRDQLKKDLPPRYALVQGATEFSPVDIQLNLRGNPEALGEVVPRRFPLVLSNGAEIPLREGSGRLALADTVAHHPLAARVAVNRIWLALFGQGLVRTPSNFGRVGDTPAVPALLDYLANRFISSGYSMKTLIREIVLSEAWQRSADANQANEANDAANRYVWRQQRRRLEAESLHDAMLAISGDLDRRQGGESKSLDPAFLRRTLYAKNSRFQQDETLSLFDLPAASVTCEQRAVTNVPLQKLYFLNSETVSKRAESLARRIAPQTSVDAGINAAWRVLLQRAPTSQERAMSQQFLTNRPTPERWKEFAQVLLASNEFAYVD